jgi:dienelactone hydrolase
MSEPTAGTIEQEFHKLYGAGAYAEAYQLATREAWRFSASSQPIVYNWRFCTASLMGEPDLALQLLEEAFEAGYWYGEADLRQDPDLAALRGRPEFERLIARAGRRRDEVLAQAQPRLKVIVPEQAAAPYPLLLALHGNRSNLEESERFWRSAGEHGWLVALPQSSQAMGDHLYGWNDHDWAMREIRQHAATILADYPIDQARSVVAGFSMGGGLAATLALGGALDVCGFVGVGPYLSSIDSVRPLIEAPRAQPLRAYLIASQRDEYCYGVAQQLAALLPQHGIPCAIELHPDLGHNYPPEFECSLLTGLSFILG